MTEPKPPRITFDHSSNDTNYSGLRDLDAFLAGAAKAAEAAVQEAEAAAAAALAEEQTRVEGKRKEKTDSINVITEFQVEFDTIPSTAHALGIFWFDSAWSAYEQETSTGRPEEVTQLIEAIGTTGSALDRLRALPTTNTELAENIQSIQQKHDELFTTLKTVTIAALEEVKKKFGGEQTVIEQQLAGLEGPLAVGVRVEQGDTPEDREKRLKQEIAELMMGEFVTGIITQEQEEIKKRKQLIAEAQNLKRQIEAVSREFLDKNLEEVVNAFLFNVSAIITKNDYTKSKSDWLQHLNSFIAAKEEEIPVLEKQTRHDQLVAVVNHTIIEDTLAQEHDPEMLREILTDLRDILGQARRNESVNQDRFHHHLLPFVFTRTEPYPPMVLELLQRYEKFGASRIFNENAHDDRSFTAVELLAPGQKRGGARIGSSLEYLTDKQRLVDLDPVKTQHLLTLQEAYKAVVPPQERGEKIFGEVSDIKKRTALPNGWTRTDSGASVATGVDPNAVENDYQKLIKRLSAVRTEGNVLDLHAPDGRFEVHTLDSAQRIILQMRRDAAKALTQAVNATELAKKQAAAAERTVAEKNQEIAAINDALAEKNQEIAARNAALAEKDQEIDALKRELAKSKRHAAEAQKYKEAIDGALRPLENALKQRPSLFGEDPVRGAAKNAVSTLTKSGQ